jgi:hypothetical protein
VGHASIANVLLSLSLKGTESALAAQHAAQAVARSTARSLLVPLLDHLILRLSSVLRRTWQISVDHIAPQGMLTLLSLQPLAANPVLSCPVLPDCNQLRGWPSNTSHPKSASGLMTTGVADGMLRPFVAFNAELRSAFQSFLNSLEERSQSLVQHQLEVATSTFAQQPPLLSSLALDDDVDELENLPPVPTQVLHERYAIAVLHSYLHCQEIRYCIVMLMQDLECVCIGSKDYLYVVQGLDGRKPDDCARDTIPRSAGQNQKE